MTKQT